MLVSVLYVSERMQENFGGFLNPLEGTWRFVGEWELLCVVLANDIQLKRRSWGHVPLQCPVEGIYIPLKGFLVIQGGAEHFPRKLQSPPV